MLKEKTVNPAFYIQQKYVSNLGTHFFQMNKNKIHYQQVSTIRNSKGSSGGRKNMIPKRNLDLHIEMKIPGNGWNNSKYKTFFCF